MEPPRRVLVVDDDPGHRSLLAAILKRISVDHDEAGDVRECLAQQSPAGSQAGRRP